MKLPFDLAAFNEVQYRRIQKRKPPPNSHEIVVKTCQQQSYIFSKIGCNSSMAYYKLV